MAVLLLVIVFKSRVLTTPQENAQQYFSNQSTAQHSNALQTSAQDLASLTELSLEEDAGAPAGRTTQNLVCMQLQDA